jgi:S-adenosylmethionine hydrolase
MSLLVTLTTDFGQREASVAEIKGVLHSRCPDVRIVDLSHDMVNVAPGPAPLVISVLGQRVVCPDNGILTMLSHHHQIDAVYGIDIPESLTRQPGQIFFGRDVFAPVVARMAAGAEPAEFGSRRDSMALLEVPHPETLGSGQIMGKIIHIDRFGNLVTNIHVKDLAAFEVQRIEAGDFPLGPLRYSYAEVPPGSPLALVGSSGYLEVAYNNDRAESRLGFGRGIKVRITVAPKAG